MTARASFTVNRRPSRAFSVDVQLPGSVLRSNVPKWRCASAASSDLRLPVGPTSQMREVGVDDERQRRCVRRGEQWDRHRGRRRVEEAQRPADGLAQVHGRRRQDEAVEGRVELDGDAVGADAAALIQVHPAASVLAPAGVPEDQARDRIREDLDRCAEVVLRALAGGHEGARAPGAGDPVRGCRTRTPSRARPAARSRLRGGRAI